MGGAVGWKPWPPFGSCRLAGPQGILCSGGGSLQQLCVSTRWPCPLKRTRSRTAAAARPRQPPQAFRILSHSYGVVLPITSLAFPPLPLSAARPTSPVNYGPPPAAQTPWLQLALYTALGVGPQSLVLAAGQQLVRLPGPLRGATHVLLWPWDAAAVKAQVRADVGGSWRVTVCACPASGRGQHTGQRPRSSQVAGITTATRPDFVLPPRLPAPPPSCRPCRWW